MTNELRDKLLSAALQHVTFDGWGNTSLLAAARDIGIDAVSAHAAFPRGAVDMVTAYHQQGDDQMVARMAEKSFDNLRYSERVAAAVRYRLEAAADRELVRRGMTLFSLPQNASDGAQLVWGTADRIWTALGDTSDDINWYSKRVILSGVYSSSVLFWLGDTSDDDTATRDFIDRRIANVMGFEKFKTKLRETRGLAPLLDIADSVFSRVRAPSGKSRTDMPGYWSGPPKGRV